MVANAQDDILHIAEEQLVVVGFGTVPWIGQPEILPHHHAVTSHAS